MTYKNFFQSKVVDCETDNYDIQVLKILIAIKESQVKANYESMTSLGGYTQFGKKDNARKHYTENLTNHSGNNNFKEIAIQSAIAKQYNKFEAIGKASSPSFFSYHIISSVKGGDC
tara:strand:- start:25 stop:372 length:348 start_codon:yes stop_codon:yes gene_type:complete